MKGQYHLERFYFEGGFTTNTTVGLSESGYLTNELGIPLLEHLINELRNPPLDDGECWFGMDITVIREQIMRLEIGVGNIILCLLHFLHMQPIFSSL
jgi:hypothetical protein